LPLDNIQPPEGEEHRDFHPHSGCAGSDDEGGNGLIQIAGENHHRQPIFDILGRGFLHFVDPLLQPGQPFQQGGQVGLGFTNIVNYGSISIVALSCGLHICRHFNHPPFQCYPTFLRRALDVMDVKLLAVILNGLLANQVNVLGGLGPALKVGHGTPVGGDDLQHTADRQIIDRLSALDQRHRALGPFYVQCFIKLNTHRYLSFCLGYWLSMSQANNVPVYLDR
jgi:hypothetical protein